MRIIIAGSREFDDYKRLELECNRIFCQFAEEKIIPVSAIESAKVIEIISGGARGADKLGEKFAKEYKLPLKIINADWNTYGKRAGYLRNEQMALYAKTDDGVLVAFWDGKSKGTKHMIDLATKHGLKVFVINF